MYMKSPKPVVKTKLVDQYGQPIKQIIIPKHK